VAYAEEATGGQRPVALDDGVDLGSQLREAGREWRGPVVEDRDGPGEGGAACRAVVLGEGAHQALHLRDTDAKVTDRRRVVQQASLDPVKVAHRPELSRCAEVGRVLAQEGHLLVEASHDAAEGVEEEARVLQ
jgi:hypothetical protein